MVHKTVAGNLPDEWVGTLIKQVCSVVRGSSPRPAGSPLYFNGDFLPWVTVADLTSSDGMYLSTTKAMLTEAGSKHTRITEPGTLMLTNSGATLGVPKISTMRCGANDGIAMLLELDGVAPEYAYYYLSSKTQYFRDVVAPGVGQPNLNTELIGAFPIPIPPLPEQKKIAQILSTWDKAITATEQLLANSQQQKKALMQQLLTGKKRLLDKNGVRFEEKWKINEIGDFLLESRTPSTTNDPSKRLTVRLNLKGVEAREFRGTEAVDSTAHFVRRAGQFIYGKQNVHKGAFGIIPTTLDSYETSQDLPAFNFTGVCDSNWFFYYMSQENFYTSLEDKMSGTGSKRLNPRAFFSIKITCPSIEEQRRIATVLSTADHEITALQQKLEALRQEKNALMQQLLTGKRRVLA